MAFFKFRKSADDAPGLPAQGESVEAMRKRATFRLIGSAVLVLAGVIGFPLLFDSQPRPIPVDIAIEIPDKAKVKPLAPPAPSAPPAMPAAPVTPAAPKDAPVAAVPAVPAVTGDKKISESDASKTSLPSSQEKEQKTAPKIESIPTQKDAKNPTKVEKTEKDGDRALALLDGKATGAAPKAPVDKPASSAAAAADTPADAKTAGRFVVQVGAYADAARVKEARAKLESAGLKTYAQVVETKDGPRTRVRVGPFADRAEADRVAQKVKSLDLQAAILSL
jgi:DedD protein